MAGSIRELLDRLRGGGRRGLLARASGGALLVQGGGAAVLLAAQVVLARVLGAEEFGLYIYVLTWARLAVLGSKLGFQTASLRFVAEYDARRQWGLLRGFLLGSRRLVLLAAASVAGAAALVTLALAGRLGMDVAAVIWLVCLFLPVRALLELRVVALQALKRTVTALATRDMVAPATLVALLGLAAVAGHRPGAAGGMAFTVLASVVALVVVERALRRSTPPEAVAAPPERQVRRWLRVALPMLLISALHVILAQTDVLMLGAFEGTTQAGIYAAASRVTNVMVMGLSSVNAILAPLIAEMYARREFEELQGLVRLAARGIFVFTALTGVVVLFAATWILLVFGEPFRVGAGALRILAVGQMVNALSGSVGYMMTMTGNERIAARVIGLAAAVNVALNAALIPLLGMEGAALATATSTALWNVLLVVQVVRRLGINPLVVGPFPARRPDDGGAGL